MIKKNFLIIQNSTFKESCKRSIFLSTTLAMAKKPCQKSFLDVHSVRSLRHYNTLLSINDLIGDFFPSASWKAVHKEGVWAVRH